MYVLKNEADVAETIYYIYVVNQEGQLVGVISLRDPIANDDDAMISRSDERAGASSCRRRPRRCGTNIQGL